MDSESILGGVTPLKARKSAGKAGKVGKKATATRAQDKSGFSRSDTIDTGKGYKANLESLTAGTRVTSSLADALGAKGPGGQPTKKGDKKDDFGKTDDFDDIFTTEYKQDPDEVEKSETHAERMKRYKTSGKQILHTYGHEFMKEFDHLIKGEGQDARIIIPDQETYDRYMDKYRLYKEEGFEKHSSVSTKTKMVAGQKYERKLKNGKPIVTSETDAEGWKKKDD